MKTHISVLGHLKNVVLEYIELLDVRLAPLTDLCTHHRCNDPVVALARSFKGWR